MNETIRLLNERKSVRVYEPGPLPPEVKKAILNAAIQAPTAGNMTLYSILDITDQALKDRLSETCDHQPFIATAPLVLVFCADYHRWFTLFHQDEPDTRRPGEGDLFLAMADAAGEDEVIFRDEGFSLVEIGADHSATGAGTGAIALYRDRFECCGNVFPINELGGFALHGPVTVNFSHGERSYELKTKYTQCTRKYQTVIHHLHSRGAAMQV